MVDNLAKTFPAPRATTRRMPRYFCDYCGVFLTHDSPAVRKAHNTGRKHKSAVRDYYSQFEENVVQAIIDTRIREYEAREAAIRSGLLPEDAPFTSCMPPFPLAPGVPPALPPGWVSGQPPPMPTLPLPNTAFVSPTLMSSAAAPLLMIPPPISLPGLPPMISSSSSSSSSSSAPLPPLPMIPGMPSLPPFPGSFPGPFPGPLPPLPGLPGLPPLPPLPGLPGLPGLPPPPPGMFPAGFPFPFPLPFNPASAPPPESFFAPQPSQSNLNDNNNA